MDAEILARHIQLVSRLLNTPPLSKFFKEGGKRIPTHACPGMEKEIGIEEAKKVVRD